MFYYYLNLNDCVICCIVWLLMFLDLLFLVVLYMICRFISGINVVVNVYSFDILIDSLVL